MLSLLCSEWEEVGHMVLDHQEIAEENFNNYETQKLPAISGMFYRNCIFYAASQHWDGWQVLVLLC